jgi:hypothetical protein
MYNEGTFAEGYAVGRDTNNNSNNGFLGGDGWWAIILLVFLFGGFGGYGFGGFGGFGGGFGGNRGGCYTPCATQQDVREAVDQQTLISKLDQQTYGLADSTYALNNSITNGFSNVQQTLCQGFNGVNTTIMQNGYNTQAGFNTLSHQLADCCCETKSAIKDVNVGVERAGWNISKQISDCCCDLEKMDMQGRFDAQMYNNNTLIAIDKLGDRLIDFMTKDKIATLTAENQNLKFAASQAAQNAFITANQEAQTAELIRRLGRDCPVPAYVVPNPNCCYQYNVAPANNCGCGSF